MSKLQDENSILNFKLMGMPLWLFAIFSVVTVVAALVGKLPVSLFGGLAASAVCGGWFELLVRKIKVIEKTLGMAFIILATATFAYFKWLPQGFLDCGAAFIQGDTNFLEFFVCALLCGSILGMNRDLLIKAGTRYFVPVAGGVLVAYTLTGILGQLFGLSLTDSIMYVAAPIMGGGQGAGSVPMSQMYAAAKGTEVAAEYSRLMPMVTLGNWVAIFFSVILNAVGKKVPVLTGNGKLICGKGIESATKTYDYQMNFTDLNCGLFTTILFTFAGIVANKSLYSGIHSYAYTIIIMVICKIAGVIPERVEFGAVKWYQYISTNFSGLLMAGLGLSTIKLASLLEALNLRSLALIVITIVGAVIGAGLFGMLVKFYFIESALTAGICMANAGGNGDIMCLSAAERMELMPFAQISSRIGGALILILQSILTGILFHP